MKKEIKIPGLNPFTFSGFFVKVKKISDPNEYETVEGIQIPSSYLTESETPISLFPLVYFRDKLMEQHASTLQLFLWIMTNLEPNADYVEVNKKYFMTKVKMSINTFTAAVKNLVDINVIAHTGKRNIFWINPHLIYRGNRLKNYPNNLEVVSEYTKPKTGINFSRTVALPPNVKDIDRAASDTIN